MIWWHGGGGGEPKYDMMTRGRGGSGYPPKMMTSFMNSPLLPIFVRTRRGRSIQSSSGKKTFTQPPSQRLINTIILCSIEVSQEMTEDASPEEVEPQYDCGKSVCIISIWSALFVLLWSLDKVKIKAFRKNQTSRTWPVAWNSPRILQMKTITTAFGISL